MIVFHALEWDVFTRAIREAQVRPKANPTYLPLETFGYPHLTLCRVHDGEEECWVYSLKDSRVDKDVPFCVVTGKYNPTEESKKSPFFVPYAHYKDNLYIVLGPYGVEE